LWTENNDTEAEYGAWEFTLAGALEDEKKRNPLSAPPDIVPHWSEGVPTLIRRTGWTERFTKNRVTYDSRLWTKTVNYEWCSPRNLSELAEKYSRLPSTRQWEWSGVYRIFVEGQAIDRLLGKDPTGTLYVGMAGHGSRKWSIMRSRIMGLATRRNHQVANRWFFSEKLEKRFPWKSMMIQWTFTDRLLNYNGEEISGAKGAESDLLHCYQNTFGEFPPFNEKS